MLREPHEVNENVESQENRIEGMMMDPHVMYLVAEVNNSVVGFMIASYKDLTRIKHVGDFIVGIDQDYWGLGIGSRLMDELMKWATEKQLKRLTLEVVEDNGRAKQLYEKHGFVVEGKKMGDHFIGDNTYLNTLVMGKRM